MTQPQPRDLLPQAGFLAWGLLLAIAVAATAQDGKEFEPPTATAEARTQIQKLLPLFVRAASDVDKEAMLPSFYRFGIPGLEFLRSLRAKSDSKTQRAIDAIDAASRLPLGLDLIERTDLPAASGYCANYFQAGEIVLFRKGEVWGGYRVAPTSNPIAGSIDIEWWTQNSLTSRLTDPGAKTGKQSATGTAVAPSMRPNAGFTDLEFAFEIESLPLRIRFVGPASYRIRYGADVAFVLTGSTEPKKLQASDSKNGWQVQDPERLTRLGALLAKYLERTIPGCEPLPVSEAERASFAQYEMVQIEYRQTRPEGVPVLLVKFADLKQIGFQPWHEDYIVHFARQVTGIPVAHVLLMAGSNRSPEANQFMVKHQWARPTKEIVAMLRANFPEEG